MSRFTPYIQEVLKGTYLSKRETKIWREEMQCHLEESAVSHIEAGFTEEQACERAMASFGAAGEIRRRIIRETYHISPRWFLMGSFVCFIALVMAFYTTMRFDDVLITAGGPSTWKHIPTPGVVVWLHRNVPLNPNRWVALGTMCLMMLFTRKRVDRMAVLVSGIPFCIPAILSLSNTAIGFGPRYLFFSAWPIATPLRIASMCGDMMLFLLGVSLYAWTRNRAVSMTPWAITIALTFWLFLRDSAQSALWEWTHNPIFWGQAPLGWWDACYTLLSVIARLLVLGLLLLVCRWIDSMPPRRVNAL